MKAWGIVSGLIGLVLVWSGRYGVFEKVLSVMVLLMFVSMVRAAIVTVPNLPEPAKGLAPTIAPGALIDVLSVAGGVGGVGGVGVVGGTISVCVGVCVGVGVGGTITRAAYGYWLRENGRTTPRHIRVMRTDNSVAYAETGPLRRGYADPRRELLHSAKIAVSTGDEGLLDLSNVLENRYKSVAGTVFLIGFRAAANEFAGRGLERRQPDVRRLRGPRARARPGPPGQSRRWPLLLQGLRPVAHAAPIALILLGQPVYLILVYRVRGAFSMPVLSVTLLWMLNTDRAPREWRNKLPANIALVLCTLTFGALALNEIRKAIPLI